jgi:putative transposase
MDSTPIQTDFRKNNGMIILQQGNIISNGENNYIVKSQTFAEKEYTVELLENVWVCSCPDFEYRKIESCKHIYAVNLFIDAHKKEQPQKTQVFAEDAIKCDSCGSIRIIKYGFDCGKQTYFCKECQHKFREPSILKKVKFTPELITLSLDLYFSGLSLRKVARNVSDHFNVDLHHSTIYKWIQRYIPKISEYVNSLIPQLSNQWHADELFVKMKGGETRKGHTGIAYLWNVMDRESRFLIASKLSEKRDINGAVQTFNEAIKNSHNNKPEVVYTDALRAYREGVKQTLGNKVEHVSKCGINKPHANNNRIERMNGTLRERVKVQRGWKSSKFAIVEGQRIYYNFVKPHKALKGKTPAEIAGIKVNDNNLLGLLKASIARKQKTHN